MAKRRKSLLKTGVSSIKKTSRKVTSGVMGVGKTVLGTAGKTVPAAQKGIRNFFGMFGLKSRKRKTRKTRKSRK